VAYFKLIAFEAMVALQGEKGNLSPPLIAKIIFPKCPDLMGKCWGWGGWTSSKIFKWAWLPNSAVILGHGSPNPPVCTPVLEGRSIQRFGG